jgi:hypothetical protein
VPKENGISTPMAGSVLSPTGIAGALSPQPRVFVLSDVRLYREGLVSSLSHYPRLSVVGAAAVSSGALSRLLELAPEVVILDISSWGSLNFAKSLALICQMQKSSPSPSAKSIPKCWPAQKRAWMAMFDPTAPRTIWCRLSNARCEVSFIVRPRWRRFSFGGSASLLRNWAQRPSRLC